MKSRKLHPRQLLAALLLMLPALAVSADQARCQKAWLFFDLGHTLLDTSDAKNFHYRPGALEYLKALQHEGYPLALITNIPEAWGHDYAEKLKRLKAEIDGPWHEPAPFPWEIFEKIYVPLNDGERKPAPTLFERGLKAVAPCPALYQAQSAAEVDAARRVGMKGYLALEKDKPPYLPVADIPGALGAP